MHRRTLAAPAALAAIALAACSYTRAPRDTAGRAGGSGTVVCRNDCMVEVINDIAQAVEVVYYAGTSPIPLGTVSARGRSAFPVNEPTLPTNVQVRVATTRGRVASCTRAVVEAQRTLRVRCTGVAP